MKNKESFISIITWSPKKHIQDPLWKDLYKSTLVDPVNKYGSISNVKAVKGIRPSIDKEAVRALENAAPFKPATQRGKPVSVRKVMPIIFQLSPKNKNLGDTKQGIVIVNKIMGLELSLKVDASYSNGEWAGIIYDENTDEPLPGANIQITGTTKGTVSNFDGRLKLQSVKSKDVVISSMGYKNVILEAK